MDGKKRLERGAFGVQGKMVSASARSGISGSDRVAQRGFLWVMHEVSPILLRVPRSTVPLRRSWAHRLGSPLLVPPFRLATEACIERADTLEERDSRPFYRTRSYGFSMRGRTTDIGRLITRLRGGPHGPRRR